ncbi:daptide biosynthesis intramembrane metalloprotease [Paenarthrobacter sp. S56]|uniref:daptide biosynthesis intramembrane metalloprotease n=1 Tax=Paenarthrobacter sp. S56 TaxID=3138179 RepID=UPI00321B7DC8
MAPPQWPVRLAAAASVDRPMQAGGPWILSLGGVPKARISADVAAVLQALDGEKSPVQVAEQLGRPWTAEDVDAVVGSVARTGIFDDGAHPAEVRWIQFRAPLTIQVTLFNPMAFLLALRPLAAVMARRESLVLALTLLLGGVIGLTTAVPEVMRVLSTPLALEAYLGVAAAMFGSTLLHELGHGLALTHFGGRPRRIGIMLFYLSPAFFCDVTDGWRLPSRMQRVVVALAGPLVHLGLGSVALCAQAFIAASTFKDGVLLYGVLCYIVAVLNLFPFIKLDGYVALMSALDTPHLRRKSMDAAAEWVGRYLLGTKVVLQRRGALRWFGVASFVSGLGFMALGFQRLIPLFLQLGMAGHVLVALACVLLVVLSARSAILFFRAAARKGSSFARRLLMGILAGGGSRGLARRGAGGPHHDSRLPDPRRTLGHCCSRRFPGACSHCGRSRFPANPRTAVPPGTGPCHHWFPTAVGIKSAHGDGCARHLSRDQAARYFLRRRARGGGTTPRLRPRRSQQHRTGGLG